jgi:hypothetical protein
MTIDRAAFCALRMHDLRPNNLRHNNLVDALALNGYFGDCRCVDAPRRAFWQTFFNK